MIRKVFRKLAAGVLCGLLAHTAPAKDAKHSADEAFLTAYDGYRAGDPIKFARAAKNLESHLLAPWLDYWRLSMRLEDADNREVREFFATHPNQFVAERMRADWLRVLGKRGDWPEFDRQAARYSP